MNNCSTVSKMWRGHITGMWHRDANRSASAAVVVRLQLSSEVAAAGYGAPKEIFLNVTELAPASEGRMIGLDLRWGGKSATRLYEGIYFDMRPAWGTGEARGGATKLLIDKIGSAVDASDVVAHGGSALHGMDPGGGVTFVGSRAPITSDLTPDDHRGIASSSRSLHVKSLDAGLVLPAAAENAWNFSAFYEHPAVADDGVSFNLMNNYYMYAPAHSCSFDWIGYASLLHGNVLHTD
jgi:hypothetical protein